MKDFVFACALVLLLARTLASAGQQKQSSTKPVPKPPNVTVCVPTPPRGPSLMMVTKDGKCAKDYAGMKSKDGKTVLYCVNTKPSQPLVVCKTQASAKK